MADAERAYRAFLASLSAGPALDDQRKEVWAALQRLAATRDARWWIDHRDEPGDVLL